MIFSKNEDFTKEQIDRVIRTDYDAIIVGGGTSGLVAALSMIEKGKSVALVEAGPFSFYTHLTNTELRFQRELGRALRRAHRYDQQLHDGSNFGPNLSCLGGRGMFWNGAAPRFHEHDFKGWPISYQAMLPYYEWMEEQFRVGTFMGETPLAMRIMETIKKNTELTPMPGPFAYNDTQSYHGMLPSGVASGLAVFMRNTSGTERQEAIDLFANSFATEITTNGRKATGIQVNLNGTKPVHLKSSLVIVASGAIESAKLVANSNVPDPHNRIGVGIMEHLFYRSFWNGSGLYDKDHRDSAIVFIPSTSQTSEQVEIHAPGNYLFAIDNETSWEPANTDRYEVMMRSFAATRKSESNRVTFNNKSLGGSLVHFTHSDVEKNMQAQMKETLASIGKALGMQLIRDGYASIGGSYHEACGLDMGNDPKYSVTDINGRIHTMDNVYVVDASTFPVIGATNPHLTIGALSRKQTLNMTN